MTKKEGQNTMECQNANRYIHLYLDGDLSLTEVSELKAHLAQCSECKLQYKQLEEVDAMVKFNLSTSFNRPERSEQDIDALTNRIMKAVPINQPRKTKKRFVQWLYRYPALTAVALFIVVMVASLAASYGEQNNVVISASQDDINLVQISGNKVIVPEDAQLTGDLVVENGIIEIKGAIDGNVTVIDGQLVMASTGYIAGQSKTIDQALDWLWYKISSSVTNIIPEWHTSTLVSLL
jgi:anti-sigma factor RsiW